jgi:pheromone shutdown protein TraB
MVGTVHISPNIGQEITEIVDRIRPQVVMVELDETRFEMLAAVHERCSQEQRLNADFVPLGDPGGRATGEEPPPSLIDLISAFQGEIAGLLGTSVGTDMYAAVCAARARGIPVEFIDLPIDDIFGRIAQISVAEQAELVAAIGEQREEATDESLHEFLAMLRDPGSVAEMLVELRTQFPELAHILLNERNRHMSAQIRNFLASRSSGIALVVVGGGHVADLLAELGQVP